MTTTFTRGQRVCTPVSDGLNDDRWWDYGIIIDIDGDWITIDRTGSITVHHRRDVHNAE